MMAEFEDRNTREEEEKKATLSVSMKIGRHLIFLIGLVVTATAGDLLETNGHISERLSAVLFLGYVFIGSGWLAYKGD